MNSLVIKTSTNQYQVHIGPQLRHRISAFLSTSYKNVLIITDSTVADLYAEDVAKAFTESTVHTVVVPAGEASKSKEQYFDLLTRGLEYHLDRDSLIVALGGGVVGDLAGFVAATYMRGIDYIQVPTTILAHDSSVGGKVAINHPEGKNLIGSFYPPVGVIYDVETLYTLPEKEVRSGYAEVVKHGLIRDSDFFNEVIQYGSIKRFSNDILIDHLNRGIAIKAEIVEQDEKESHVRKYLNFGHTLAHALEAELGYGKITHGEAVAVGMLFAMKVSEDLLSSDLPYQELSRWLEQNDYPLDLPKLSIESVLSRMKKDKKSKDQQVQMVLLEEVGKPVLIEVEDKVLSRILQDFLSKKEVL